MRRKWSIKAKLTGMYAGSMLLLICVSLGVLFSLSSQEILSSVQSDLREQVQEGSNELEEEEGRLQVDTDFYAMKNNVYLSVYSREGEFLYGRIPAGFDLQPSFENDKIRTIKNGQEQFYIFDMQQSVEDYGTVYIRGITSVTKAEQSFNVTVRLALVMLPVLAAVLVLFSYFFIRRAFLPVKKMTETVQEIRRQEDLSKRVGLPAVGKDEVYHLAATFDQLLDGVEKAFTRERQFTSDVSHELRTPLAVIRLQCEEIIHDQNVPDQVKKQTEVIYKKVLEMSSMVSQLLLLSRADQGRQVMQKEWLDISELTEMSAEQAKILAGEKSIEIITDIEPDIFFMADESFFIRVLVNLLSNAVSYGKKGGWIKVSLKKEAEEAVLCIADNGIGISQEDLPHIWKRFYRADAARSDGVHSGLGLSMVKWIVKEHNGTIEASSRKGEGSTFTCRFPLENKK